MKIPYYHVDAFTNTLFKGNPAGVCPLDTWPDDTLLQAIAKENNLSETAFLVGKNNTYELRWFTPVVEVDLCGHATLAASFVLYTLLNAGDGPLHFSTRSGELTVSREKDLFFLDFPSRTPSALSCPELLSRGLGATPAATYLSRDILAVFNSEEEIRALKPDFTLLSKLDCLGCIVTAPGLQVDFVSRFFAPSVGINEDPVTGSAHCTLIPYWAERLHRTTLTGHQVSNRGGELLCQLKGNRVRIGGKAALYMTGALEIQQT